MNSGRIGDTDLQGMRASIAFEKYGYSEADFEWVHAEGGTAAETVYVIYRPTGFRRMYGRASWQAEFEEDLRNNIFRSGS